MSALPEVFDSAEPKGSMADAATVAPAEDKHYVTFDVAGELFAVPMAPVQEIIRVPNVARLPLAPPAFDGLANLRGRVLPIVSLRRLFNTDEREHDDATRALVIDIGQPLGFVVDRVASVVSIEPHEIEPASAIHDTVQSGYLTGVINRTGPDGQRQLTMVLDFAALVRGQLGALGGEGAGRAERSSAEPIVAAAVATAANDELRLVSFAVADQEYAIDIGAVREIVQVPAEIVTVPNTPAHVLGLMSLRQRLLPLVSLRSLFGLPPLAPQEQHRVVVVALPGGGQVGLVTDSVKEVLTVSASQTEPVPGVLSRSGDLEEFEAICRLDEGRRLVSIISAARLLGVQAVADAVDAAGHVDPLQAQRADHDQENAMSRLTKDTEADSDNDAQVVIFRLGAEEFGVPIMSVQEIVRVPDTLTRVPKAPAFVEGVINLRGTVLPVVDQRRRLGLDTIERHDGQRIMVYTLRGVRTGFIVDSVAEVLRIGRSHIEPAPVLSHEQGSLIKAVAKLDGGRRMVLLIEPEQLLGSDERREVEGLSGPQTADDDLPAPLARAA